MSNLISASISATQVTNISTAVQTVKDNLPPAGTITADEKKAKQQLGNNGISYVNQCVIASETYFEDMPKKFDLAEFKKDHTLYTQLTAIEQIILEVLLKVQTMRAMAGIDLMDTSNEVYKAIGDAASNNVAMRAIAAALGEFYKKRNQTEKKPD